MLSKATITASLFVTCATSDRDRDRDRERERERERERKLQRKIGSCSGKVAALHNENDTGLEDFFIPHPFHVEVAGLGLLHMHWSNYSRHYI